MLCLCSDVDHESAGGCDLLDIEDFITEMASLEAKLSERGDREV